MNPPRFISLGIDGLMAVSVKTPRPQIRVARAVPLRYRAGPFDDQALN